jgi:SAM-dependent methyltransferase
MRLNAAIWRPHQKKAPCSICRGQFKSREEGGKVKRRVLAAMAVVAILGGGFALRVSLAQSMHETPAEGGDMSHHHGHHTVGSSDGAFHRRFDDAEKWAQQFDKPERDAWQKPDEVIEALRLDRAASVADVGAGTGYFSVKIAKRIPEGKVFAADAESDMVRYLGERAGREHVSNLVPVQASADGANLPEPVDLILVVDTYHHIGRRIAYFSKLKSSLRPGARLAIIDFKADSPNGPPVEHRISSEKVTEELTSVGYTLAESHNFLPRQYFLVFKAGA